VAVEHDAHGLERVNLFDNVAHGLAEFDLGRV
jgi:hypothetical protein